MALLLQLLLQLLEQWVAGVQAGSPCKGCLPVALRSGPDGFAGSSQIDRVLDKTQACMSGLTSFWSICDKCAQ